MDQPSSTIRAAIRSEGADPGELLKRVNATLALYYDPDFDAQTKAAVREEFVRALSDLPLWAIHRAFDSWIKQHKRRPSPGEIVILANNEIRPYASELARREKDERERAEYERDRQARRCKPDDANAIMERAGFTPKRFAQVEARPMAGSTAELEADTDRMAKPHWSELVAPDSPEMQALRAARLANPLMRAGMKIEPEGDAA
jgi:hypothetical protein